MFLTFPTPLIATWLNLCQTAPTLKPWSAVALWNSPNHLYLAQSLVFNILPTFPRMTTVLWWEELSVVLAGRSILPRRSCPVPMSTSPCPTSLSLMITNGGSTLSMKYWTHEEALCLFLISILQKSKSCWTISAHPDDRHHGGVVFPLGHQVFLSTLQHTVSTSSH